MFFEATHAVTHQAEPRINVNEFRANIALVEAVAAYVLDAARRRSHRCSHRACLIGLG